MKFNRLSYILMVGDKKKSSPYPPQRGILGTVSKNIISAKTDKKQIGAIAMPSFRRPSPSQRDRLRN